jgi:hypothetical protein
MRPERELLFEQATACRQLALICQGEDAERLRKLAEEYETAAELAACATKPVTPPILAADNQPVNSRV